MRDGCTCHIGVSFLGGAGLTREFAPRVVRFPTDGQCGFSGRRPQGRGHNEERIGPSGQTHVSLRSSVYHRLRSLFGSSVWPSSVCAMRDRDDGVGRRRRDRRLKQWLRHERLSVQMALAKFKRHSSQRARLARENSARRTQLHVAETTSPGERPGVPQETAPQEWLAAPCKPELTGSPSCCSAQGWPTRRRTWSR